MIQQIKLIRSKSYDELEVAINTFLKENPDASASLGSLVAGNDGSMVAVMSYMKNPLL